MIFLAFADPHRKKVKRQMMSTSVFNIGDKVGFLTIIADLPAIDRRRRYRVRCICGAEKPVIGRNLAAAGGNTLAAAVIAETSTASGPANDDRSGNRSARADRRELYSGTSAFKSWSCAAHWNGFAAAAIS